MATITHRIRAVGHDDEVHADAAAGVSREHRGHEDLVVGMGEDHPQLNDFKKGLRVGMSGTVKTMVDSWAKTEVKNKGAVISQGRPAVRFRFASSDSGIAFVDFILHAGKEGKPAIVNIYNQSLGYDLAVQLRQIATPILAELDKTVLERLVGKPGLSQAELQKFGEMSRKFAKGDNKGCVEDFKKLTPALRDSFAAYAIYINALQKAGDDAGYREALKQGALKFKQASFDFMLVDLYFMEKQYDKAAECIERFMQVVGRDAALLALESSLLSQKGDTSGAHKLIGEALKLEPDCEFAHTTALDIYLAAKDFAATRDTMIFLEENAGYEFKEAMGDPAWAEFLKSPEAARWK